MLSSSHVCLTEAEDGKTLLCIGMNDDLTKKILGKGNVVTIQLAVHQCDACGK
jgi:hypothetical protein